MIRRLKGHARVFVWSAAAIPVQQSVVGISFGSRILFLLREARDQSLLSLRGS